MNTAYMANKIFEIFALKENQNLTNEQQKNMVEKIIEDVYNKGRRSGHNKAVEICKNALNGLEHANNNLY